VNNIDGAGASAGGPTGMKFGSIQIFRAIAANFVVLSHLRGIEGKYGGGYAVLPDWIGAAGPAGVHFFFVISGFVMVFASQGVNWWTFLLSRITRIYPPYWVYTSIIVLILWTFPGQVSSDFHHPSSLFRSYVLLPDQSAPLLTVGWSLIFEMYFYLVWTLVLAFAVRIQLALMLWTIFTFWLIFLKGAWSPVMETLSSPLTFEFIAGAIVALVASKHSARFGSLILLIGLGGLVVGFLVYLRGPPNDMSLFTVFLFLVPFSMILYSGVSAERKIKARASRLKWMTVLGDASYSTYLSHALVLSALGRIYAYFAVTGLMIECAFVIIALIVANVAGLASYFLLEKPILRISRHLFRTSPSLPATA
jgi:exopolysaccharide production protein ExoZ